MLVPCLKCQARSICTRMAEAGERLGREHLKYNAVKKTLLGLCLNAMVPHAAALWSKANSFRELALVS